MVDSKSFSTVLNLAMTSKIEISGFDGKVNIAPATAINIDAQIHGLSGMNPNDLEKAQIKVEILGTNVNISPYYGFKIPMVGKHPSADLTLGIPVDTNLSVKTNGGLTTISKMTGPIDINLNGGELVMDELGGNLDLSVRVGKARIADSTAKLNVTLWGGEVLIARKNPWAAGQELAITGPGGQVTVEVPDGSSLTFEASSVLGDVVSEINWDKTESKGGVGSYFKGVLGAGSAKISINSAKTKIILRKPM